MVAKKITEEISEDLTYHGLHHTLDVYEACNAYIKRMNVKPHDAYLLRTAALTHDVGILSTYTHHEEEGIKFVKRTLPDFGYTKKEIDKVCELIMATQLPQDPKNELERIICDADLDYLGRPDYYEIAALLFQELQANGVVRSEEQWRQIQISFLEKHQYHTEYARKNRQPIKERRLEELKAV